jgi:hypothetical protein
MAHFVTTTNLTSTCPRCGASNLVSAQLICADRIARQLGLTVDLDDPEPAQIAAKSVAPNHYGAGEARALAKRRMPASAQCALRWSVNADINFHEVEARLGRGGRLSPKVEILRCALYVRRLSREVEARTVITNLHERRSIMHEEKKAEAGAVAPVDDDEDAREFEALIRDIAELRDADTIVEHMDMETYRKGKRT